METEISWNDNENVVVQSDMFDILIIIKFTHLLKKKKS